MRDRYNFQITLLGFAGGRFGSCFIGLGDVGGGGFPHTNKKVKIRGPGFLIFFLEFVDLVQDFDEFLPISVVT